VNVPSPSTFIEVTTMNLLVWEHEGIKKTQADWRAFLEAQAAALHPTARVEFVWSMEFKPTSVRVEGESERTTLALQKLVRAEVMDAWERWCSPIAQA
jgi:hypothetical protein